MKKILIIFLGIFSLLIINGGYCLAKQDVESFSVIENKMSEEFEKDHAWELSRNRMIEKTIKKIEEMQK